jgi:hypothetical protein
MDFSELHMACSWCSLLGRCGGENGTSCALVTAAVEELKRYPDSVLLSQDNLKSA